MYPPQALVAGGDVDRDPLEPEVRGDRLADEPVQLASIKALGHLRRDLGQAREHPRVVRVLSAELGGPQRLLDVQADRA